MAKDAQYFSDGAAYERFMGRWSRAAGEVFLDWVAPPRSARWLDIGCGTGVFTELVLDTCAPATVVAVDPSEAQIDIARATRVIDVTVSFPDFNEFWRSQTPGYSPTGKMIAARSEPEREKLIESVRERLPAGPDGSIDYSARANAIKARVSE